MLKMGVFDYGLAPATGSVGHCDQVIILSIWLVSDGDVLWQLRGLISLLFVKYHLHTVIIIKDCAVEKK